MYYYISKLTYWEQSKGNDAYWVICKSTYAHLYVSLDMYTYSDFYPLNASPYNARNLRPDKRAYLKEYSYNR